MYQYYLSYTICGLHSSTVYLYKFTYNVYQLLQIYFIRSVQHYRQYNKISALHI